MTNPLLQKYEELYGKKEEPKPQKIHTEKLKELRDTSTIPIAKLTSYDPHSTENSFLQVAELIKQKKGKIISMSMSVDATKLFAKTISFEVMVADWDTP